MLEQNELSSGRMVSHAIRSQSTEEKGECEMFPLSGDEDEIGSKGRRGKKDTRGESETKRMNQMEEKEKKRPDFDLLSHPALQHPSSCSSSSSPPFLIPHV